MTIFYSPLKKIISVFKIKSEKSNAVNFEDPNLKNPSVEEQVGAMLDKMEKVESYNQGLGAGNPHKSSPVRLDDKTVPEQVK